MVHRREINGQEVLFGNQGDLFNGAMIWFGHETGSVWSQPTGEAILGPRAGERLQLLPSQLTTWDAWRSAHPETLALDSMAPRAGFNLASMSIAVDFASGAVQFSVENLRAVGVANHIVQVGSVELAIAVVIDPADENRWVAFSRQLDDEVVVELTMAGGVLLDTVTGTTFDPAIGRALDGPLTGQRLDPLPGFTIFPDDFEHLFPAGHTWNPPTPPGG
jgi:hypothetical protein